jgi:hypothetical protein
MRERSRTCCAEYGKPDPFPNLTSKVALPYRKGSQPHPQGVICSRWGGWRQRIFDEVAVSMRKNSVLRCFNDAREMLVAHRDQMPTAPPLQPIPLLNPALAQRAPGTLPLTLQLFRRSVPPAVLP